MLDYYYELRGWGRETGIPTRKKLQDLELAYVANELESLGRISTKR
jgi:aldehyde:ferredoxin oxidoreductase